MRRDARAHVQGVGLGGRRVPDGRQRGPVVRTQRKNPTFGDAEDADTGGVVPSP